MERILPLDAKPEKLAGAFRFTEGPVWLRAAEELLFSDIPSDRIVVWRMRHEGPGIDTFRHPSGQSNGLTLDGEGRLIACEHKNRRVSRTEKDGTVTVLAERFRGKRLNSPNDVVVSRNGSVYFTDPPYGVAPEERELDFQGVYRLDPRAGSLSLLVEDFVKPNGLAFSPDGKTLYVADTERNHIRAFAVGPDGSLGRGREFAPVKGPDGMKVDRDGNVYCTSSDGVVVLDPSGKRLGVIEVPEVPANCAFGDPDWKTLFMTCRTGLYGVRIAVPGMPVPCETSGVR